ncbi:hypothetical protein [Cellulomonas cellasea]|uniref:Pilus assembly protein PilO n=1 Tax=Cellulomonas cellasea TaxID=43670 RepID=A0A7W4UDX1_9CELL|nr:hypothetical protein [Cellulomonas cellasea]MBB2921860.1 hypothetical protein [Cellulomonas cellasea]
MASKTTWVGGTAFAAVLALAGGWTLGVSPQIDAADEAELQKVSVDAQNATLEVKLAELKAQYENLEQYRAELAALEVQIPRTAQLSDYLRQVSAIAEASGAFVVSVKPGPPVAISDAAAAGAAPAPAAESADASAPAEGGEAAEPTSDAEGTTAQPVPPAVSGLNVPGFVAVPVDITLLGSVEKVTTALAQLQTGSTRLFLVTAITGAGTDAKEASEGKPATNRGDIEMTISGYVYVVESLDAPVEDEATEAPALPPADLTKPLTGA